MKGDIFQFPMSDRVAYLHHVGKDPTFGDIVAVHTGREPPAEPEALASDAFALLFPVGAAAKAGLITKIGRRPIPEKFFSGGLRYPVHDLQGGFLHWVIVEGGRERRGVTELSQTELQYAFAVAVNEAALEKLIKADSSYESISFAS